MSLITDLFDSSLLQALSADSGDVLKKSERANTIRDQPRSGTRLEGGAEGSESKGAPLLDLRSSAIFPALTISCHSPPSERLEQAILI